MREGWERKWKRERKRKWKRKIESGRERMVMGDEGEKEGKEEDVI